MPCRAPAGWYWRAHIRSLIVAEFASLADARTWAEADPYVAAGVYADVAIKPFKRVFPA